MKMLVITSRDLEKGSTKYRIAQFLGFLRNNGVETEFIRRNEIDSSAVRRLPGFDIVFNQKCLINSSLSKRIFRQSRKTIFDFDDAIYTRPGRPHSFLTALRVRRRFSLWIENSDIVITASEFLAQKARRYSSSVTVLPMALDLDTWKPAASKDRETVTIGWAGAPVNIGNLERLDGVLTPLLKRYRNARLAVFSGSRPRLSCPFDYHPFSPGAEASFIQQLDVGLLPLVDDEYSRGKSPVKALQYLACGVPVVGNIFGAGREILGPDSSIAVSDETGWSDALGLLITDPAVRTRMGASGRSFVMKNHDALLVRDRLLSILLDDGQAEQSAERAGERVRH